MAIAWQSSSIAHERLLYATVALLRSPNITRNAANWQQLTFMNASKRQVRPPQYIFVLWGDQFDETVAVLAITQLRKAGYCVKVVGLNGPCVKGAHGLGLLADLTLDQALPLADQAIGVVIPCTTTDLARVENDPRVGAFLLRAKTFGTRSIAKPSILNECSHASPKSPDDLQVFIYTDRLKLLEIVTIAMNALIANQSKKDIHE